VAVDLQLRHDIAERLDVAKSYEPVHQRPHGDRRTQVLPRSADKYSMLLNLQRTAGNKATTALIAQFRQEGVGTSPALAVQRKGDKGSWFSKLFKEKKKKGKQKEADDEEAADQEASRGPSPADLYRRWREEQITATHSRLAGVVDAETRDQLAAVGLKKVGRQWQDWAGEHVPRPLIGKFFDEAGGIPALLKQDLYWNPEHHMWERSFSPTDWERIEAYFQSLKRRREKGNQWLRSPFGDKVRRQDEINGFAGMVRLLSDEGIHEQLGLSFEGGGVLWDSGGDLVVPSTLKSLRQDRWILTLLGTGWGDDGAFCLDGEPMENLTQIRSAVADHKDRLTAFTEYLHLTQVDGVFRNWEGRKADNKTVLEAYSLYRKWRSAFPLEEVGLAFADNTWTYGDEQVTSLGRLVEVWPQARKKVIKQAAARLEAVAGELELEKVRKGVYKDLDGDDMGPHSAQALRWLADNGGTDRLRELGFTNHGREWLYEEKAVESVQDLVEKAQKRIEAIKQQAKDASAIALKLTPTRQGYCTDWTGAGVTWYEVERLTALGGVEKLHTLGFESTDRGWIFNGRTIPRFSWLLSVAEGKTDPNQLPDPNQLSDPNQQHDDNALDIALKLTYSHGTLYTDWAGNLVRASAVREAEERLTDLGGVEKLHALGFESTDEGWAFNGEKVPTFSDLLSLVKGITDPNRQHDDDATAIAIALKLTPSGGSYVDWAGRYVSRQSVEDLIDLGGVEKLHSLGFESTDDGWVSEGEKLESFNVLLMRARTAIDPKAAYGSL
jgi:hypothetical protein